MKRMSFCIAIDGPAGAGKSTIAKMIAKEMNLIYVDTGAMYRAMAYYLLTQNADLDNAEDISSKCQGADIKTIYEKGEQVVILNGENVNPYLRTEAVGAINYSIVLPANSLPASISPLAVTPPYRQLLKILNPNGPTM